jgi:poly-gamma-glutamate system protein
MKKIYWRPRSVSRMALVLIAVFSVTGLVLVEKLRIQRPRPFYAEKMAAAEKAARAMEQIYYARSEIGPEIDPSSDPAESGLIGLASSSVTSISGLLVAKQTSVNPNFAAAIVDMLKRAGVERDDVVAVGCSGSFPALNICAYAALESIRARPVVISSAAASEWGANVPKLLWIDMERILYDEGIFAIRSAAASLGGYDDRGVGLTKEGRTLVEEAIELNGLRRIDATTLAESVDARMELYRQFAGQKPIRAYINIGGGAVSVGRSQGKGLFQPGLNLRSRGATHRVDAVMARFSNAGVPVIHLEQVESLAEQYGLELAPRSMPEAGRGDNFVGRDYNNWLASILLASIIASLYGFIRSDIGFRLLRVAPRRTFPGHPEPMV